MSISRTGILLLGFLLAACILSCTALALGGAQKYKVDLTNILMKAQDEINSEGSVSDKTYNKFKSFMEKSEEQFGMKGSYVKAENVMKCFDTARSEPDKAFYQYQSAKIEITYVFDMLKTEVAEE
jgi:hypothetical protein